MAPHRSLAISFLSSIFLLGTFVSFTNPAHAGIQASFESPGNNEEVAGIAVVRGWAFDDIEANNITSVELLIDGAVHALGRIACCTARPDVEDSFPAEGNSLNSGFGLTFNWGNLSEGPHTLQVRVQSSGSPEFLSDVRTVTVVNPGGFDFLDQLSLDPAEFFTFAELQDDGTLFVECAQARDASSGATKFVDLTYRWQPACQCLTLISSVDDEECNP